MIDFSTLSMTDIIRLQNQLQQELSRRFERQLLLVYSDVAGSTPYFARFGDAAGRQLLQLHLDLLGQCLDPEGGRFVDTAGDCAFCVFPDAEAAVRGVIAFQRAMEIANAVRSHPQQLRVRIGLHFGTVLTDGVAVSGDAVNLCARVAASAEPGAIRLTRQVFQALGPVQRLHCHSVGSVTLKGVAAPVELLELAWRDPAIFPRRVRIEETGEEIKLPQQDIVSFGRLPDHDGVRANDIVLGHPAPELTRLISRWHFELRRTPIGLCVRAVSDNITQVDGQRLDKGVDAPVRSGSRIGVGGVLTLRLIGADHPLGDEDDSRTMRFTIVPGATR